MKTNREKRVCMHCGAAPARATGVCRRCYSRLRYRESTEGKRKRRKKTSKHPILLCHTCQIPMFRDEIIRETSGSYRKRRFMLRIICPNCGYSSSIHP